MWIAFLLWGRVRANDSDKAVDATASSAIRSNVHVALRVFCLSTGSSAIVSPGCLVLLASHE